MATKELNVEDPLLKDLMSRLMKLNGLTIVRLAEQIGSTQATVGNFISEKNGKKDISLTTTQVETLFGLLDINLRPYLKRLDLVETLAEGLRDRKIEDVAEWTREQLADNCPEMYRKQIMTLPDYDLEGWSNAFEYGLVDLQGTFAAFKGLLVKQMKLNMLGRPTPGTVQKAELQLTPVKALENKPKQINEISKEDPETGSILSSLIAGAAGIAIGLATCLLVNTFSRED